MAARLGICAICENGAGGECTEHASVRDSTIFRCDVCGEYELTRTAKVTLDRGGWNLSMVQRAAISHRIRLASDENKALTLTTDWIERFVEEGALLPSPSVQATNAIRFVGDEIKKTGRNLESLPLCFYAVIGAPSPDLAHQIVNEFIDEGALTGIDTSTDDGPGMINVGMKRGGWDLYEAECGRKASAEWVRAADALVMLKPILIEPLARLRICERAHAGLIRARAEHFQAGERRFQNHEIPKQFWWAEGHEALVQDWAAGDFSTWIEQRTQLKAFGVTFARADVAKILPAVGSEGQSEPTGKRSKPPILLDGIHAQIVAKCNGLYEAKHYAEAVEKSFKVVRDRLRALTGFERASEAFGKGKLHIKGAAAPNVDADFNEGAKFLMMAIDMFRNEKSHTSDANISDPARAYQYLCVSSLAMTLLDEAEISP